jgi:hypothetical protein
MNTIMDNASNVPPMASFNLTIDVDGPMINVVPVSAMAYNDVLIAVEST